MTVNAQEAKLCNSRLNKTHRSLPNHDSDLDTSAKDDSIQMEQDGQDHEEDNHTTIKFHNNNEVGEPTKLPTPPPTVPQKQK